MRSHCLILLLMGALISAKPPGFGTIVGWRLLCEYWSTPAFRKISLTNKRNRLAHGDTVFHCSGARSATSTRQHLKLKKGKDPGISGAWQHMHNLHRGTDQEKICSQRTSKRWGMGSNTGGSPSHEKDHSTNDDGDDEVYDNRDNEGYGEQDDGYGFDYDNGHYDQDGYGHYGNYGDDGEDY